MNTSPFKHDLTDESVLSLTTHQRKRAMLVVAANTKTIEQTREILEMLGLIGRKKNDEENL